MWRLKSTSKRTPINQRLSFRFLRIGTPQDIGLGTSRKARHSFEKYLAFRYDWEFSIPSIQGEFLKVRSDFVKALVPCLFSFAIPASFAQKADAPDLLLRYRQPAPVWSQALPVGNGRIGAMVFGGANLGTNNGDQQDDRKNASILDGKSTRGQDEHLQLNEDTLWQGARENHENPAAKEGFKQVRSLLLASKGVDGAKIAEAEEIAGKTMLPTPKGMPGYSTLGDLYLHSTEDKEISDYRRQLDLSSGVVTVSYQASGVRYTREVFSSAPDQVIVLHLAASKPGSISFDLAMDRPEDFVTRTIGDHDVILQQGPESKGQIKFQGQARVLNRGGSVQAEKGKLLVRDADEVTILIAASTDFRGGRFQGGDPAQACAQTLEAAQKKGYSQLKEAAAQDEAHWMKRVTFQIGARDSNLEALPTDERLRRVSAGGKDLGLQALYFQYARYLLIGSSRTGGLPANLQGLWAGGINNPWGSKWTININTEMNYWVAEAANLGELQQPLFDLIDMVRTPGSGTGTEIARDYYDSRGFVIHHNTDIWGDAQPIDGVPYGIWPMGGAWLALHAWDHYAFTEDKSFLKKRAWPILHDASLFFLDYLTEDGHGHLVTGPSLSPENKYKLPDGTAHSLTMGPTMDIEIVRELFERTIQTSEVLGVEEAFRSQVKAAMDKLPPFKIGKRGNLQEWQEDYEDEAPGHRHISHLWALFPGTQISPEHTPELAKAAQTTLETRLAHGGGQTGWSRAWVVNYWDHLRNGAQAYDSMQVLFRQSTFPNLMDTHPPGVFQIDGNLGGANGMLEAVVQSRWYPDHVEVDLLPALPPEWEQGHIDGIRLRGGAELEVEWSASRLQKAVWRPQQNGVFDLRLPANQVPREVLADGRKINWEAGTEGSVRLKLEAGKTYVLRF